MINRGNRRVGPFGAPRTRDAFETCLFAACARSKWVLHAYVVMSNHFHLAVETPAGNLAAGMQWLQATFTNRYNRFRGQAGHGTIFQGRYKALVVQAGAPLGMVCEETDAPNGWLAERLKMGSATRVSQVVGAVARQPTSPAAEIFKRLSERLAT